MVPWIGSRSAWRDDLIYYLSLGSNLGDRARNLKKAIEELKEHVVIEALSSLYDTEPWGYREQGKFLNMVVKVKSQLAPSEVLRATKEVETRIGGKKKKRRRWGERMIDIDIVLAFDDGKEITIKTDELTIPHPNIEQRNFVLIPLKEIENNVRIKNVRIKDRNIDYWIDKNGEQKVKKVLFGAL